jgi:hypothetical protein
MGGFLKSKIVDIVGIAVLTMAMCQTPALATTYDYVGNLYTSNTDPGVLGTNLTGAVTFNFDTSSFTGQLHSGDVSSLIMTSGTLSFDLTLSAGTQFDLTNGSITDWAVSNGSVPTGWAVGSGGSVLGAPFGGQQNSVLFYLNGVYQNAGAFDTCSISSDPSCHLQGWSEELDPVSPTPLPAAFPMFLGGAGLVGLLARRRKKEAATRAA